MDTAEMPNRTGKNTTFSRKKQILVLILNELRVRTQRCGKKKGDFAKKSPHLWLLVGRTVSMRRRPSRTLRQCNALTVADIDTVRCCAVGMSSRKIVERVGLSRGRSACLRNAGALQRQSEHGGGV